VQTGSELDERFSRLERKIATVFDLSAAQQRYGSSIERLDELTERVQAKLAAENQSYPDLAELKAAIRARGKANNDEIETIKDAIRTIEIWRSQWLDDYQKWTRWENTLLKEYSISSVKLTFDKAKGTISEALELIQTNLEPLLLGQQKRVDIRQRIYQLNAQVDRAILSLRGGALQKKTPILFSAQFLLNLRNAIYLELPRQLRISWPDWDFFVKESWVIILQIFVALAIAFGVRRNRPRLHEMPKWRFVAKRPYAAGLTFAVPILSAFYGPLPAIWSLLLWVVAGISLSRLASGITADPLKRRAIYGLAAVVIINQLFDVIGIPLTFTRLYVFGVSLAGFLYFLLRSFKAARDGSAAFYCWMLRIAALLLLVVFISEIVGQAAFAMRVFDTASRSVIFVLFGWMLITLIRGGFDLVVRSPLFQKVYFLKENADVIYRRVMLIVQILIWSFIFANILADWGIFSLPMDAIQGLLGFGFTIGTKKITMGLVFVALAILYGAFLISWAVQAVFMEEVLRRRHVESGVRMSMARLIHYALVLVGFLVALSALGFDLKNITILGGALGIGIGFGLQTVVSNFVCGLILLFERPIKVGDVIELGTQRGRVKNLGLRATVVETFDRAEVVVPNTNLISNEVTNWTLADRQMRITIPVGVAYGSDIELVMKTLTEIAEENTLVLKNPAPQILFWAFGASSLDFEFRVWIADFSDRRQVQSDLLLEIDRRFRNLDIEIPFPQSDLHVRSVDQTAAVPRHLDDSTERQTGSNSQTDGTGEGKS
jgi:small-conductance mechanosensitive channel